MIFRGTRGVVHTSVKDKLRYCENMPCVEIRKEGNQIIILDRGKGIRAPGDIIIQQYYTAFKYTNNTLLPGSHTGNRIHYCRIPEGESGKILLDIWK